MNVLVYASSASQGLSNALRSVLSPFYTVQSILPTSLATQPWAASCALLVLSAPLSLPRPAREAIQEYITAGGRILGIGLGITTLPHRPAQDRFDLWDAKSGTATVPQSPQAVSILSPPLSILLHPGGPPLSGLRPASVSFQLTASDNQLIHGCWEEPVGAIAGVEVPVGSGRAAFWGVSPYIDGIGDTVNVHAFLRYALTSLGLSVPPERTTDETLDLLPAIPRHPLPQLLLHPRGKGRITETVLRRLGLSPTGTESSSGDSELGVIKDSADTFCFYRAATLEHAARMVAEARASEDVSSHVAMTTDAPRVVLVLPPTVLPTRELTPRFDAEKYFAVLAEVQGDQASGADSWGVGEALFYGEAVTSTQTMLERYAPPLRLPPTPILPLSRPPSSHKLPRTQTHT